MFCVRCGCRLDDGYQFCPKCGSAVAGQQESAKSDIDKIADEIFWKNPKLSISNVSKLQKSVHIDADRAYALLEERVKELKRGADKRLCPRCGSDDIVRSQDDGSSSTISISEGIYHTTYRKGKIRCKCLSCGKKWKF